MFVLNPSLNVKLIPDEDEDSKLSDKDIYSILLNLISESADEETQLTDIKEFILFTNSGQLRTAAIGNCKSKAEKLTRTQLVHIALYALLKMDQPDQKVINKSVLLPIENKNYSGVELIEMSVIAKLLSENQDLILISNMLKYLLWGPKGDHEDDPQKWLHLERASALNDIVSQKGLKEAHLSEEEQMRINYLLEVDPQQVQRMGQRLEDESKEIWANCTNL